MPAAAAAAWPPRYGDPVEPIWSIVCVDCLVFVYGAWVSWYVTGGNLLYALPSLLQLLSANANNGFLVSPYSLSWRIADYAGAFWLFGFGLSLTYDRLPLVLVLLGALLTAALAVWQATAPTRASYEVRCNLWHLWVGCMYTLALALYVFD
jgi:hypothetical protein